jgi:hypothetical protein
MPEIEALVRSYPKEKIRVMAGLVPAIPFR